jgi:hypothetical protein
MNWRDISYLQQGGNRQQQAYKVLMSLGIFETLAEFDPVLVGTIPIQVDLPDSDLDIICEVCDLDRFERLLRAHYACEVGFVVKQKWGKAVLVCDFEYGGFPIQVFGQDVPVRRQRAYRHMLIEARLLEIAGEEARRAIRALKASGLKTEPAFARWFSLSGDPYLRLLELAEHDDDFLRRWMHLSSKADPST